MIHISKTGSLRRYKDVQRDKDIVMDVATTNRKQHETPDPIQMPN